MKNKDKRDAARAVFRKNDVMQKKYSEICEYVIFFCYFCRWMYNDAVCRVRTERVVNKLLKNNK